MKAEQLSPQETPLEVQSGTEFLHGVKVISQDLTCQILPASGAVDLRSTRIK